MPFCVWESFGPWSWFWPSAGSGRESSEGYWPWRETRARSGGGFCMTGMQLG